jgi:hypothetical protein
MPVFNNTKILKSGDDIVLGSVISNEQFGFEAYNNLIFDRIEDLVLNYVNDRVKEKFLSFERPDMNINEYREAVLSDIAQKVQEKLNVSISYENEYTAYGVIAEAITDSDQFQNFLTVIKERFGEYENSIAFSGTIPLNSQDTSDYFSEENINEVLLDTNIMDYIETLYTYGLPILL